MDELRAFKTSLISNYLRLWDHYQRLFWGKGVLKRTKITPHLYLSGQFKDKNIPQLKAEGIEAIVNMRLVPDSEAVKNAGFETLHLPTPDRTPVSLSDLLTGADFIQKRIEKGKKVLVHCMYGEGRAPSVVVAYLISQGMTLEHALALVTKKRPYVNLTLEQAHRLQEFEETYPKLTKS